jgi:hypothetical protein
MAALLGTIPDHAAAQASFTPSYNAPYRAFSSHEFGVTLSFPDRADFGLEGQYRFGNGRYDIGLRGGFIDYDGGSDAVLGVEGRWRVIDHDQVDFPLDGALVLGVGTAEGDVWTAPMAGLSLGRRVQLEDFEFVAYGQPTFFVFTGNGDTNLDFGFGFGIDFKVGRALDLRTSVGTFDGPRGIAFSLVWVR